MSAERSHELARQVDLLYSRRSPRDHLHNDFRQREMHARREMNFQVRNPVTGLYDKFVDVPVNSRVVVMDKWHFDGLVDSVGPYLRYMRKFIQKVYSGKELTPENLGIESLPVKLQELVIKIVKENIYFEPEFAYPDMGQFPFLALAGMDGTILDPDNPEARYFETNLGTPSGLSNNKQMLEANLSSDFELREIIGRNLAYDDTFQIFRDSFESSALAWTGRKEGITVMVSPGVYNAAHADVASIARYAGFPLVNLSDLYIDNNHDVRLNTGEDSEHPLVTGFAGRREDSFIFQNEFIPMISPNNVELNARLSKELGVSLRPGAIYNYIYNLEGEAVDVERDESGEPVFQKLWDQLGENPNGRTSNWTLADALVNRKIYYPIGGRIGDDKRLFHIVTQYLLEDDPDRDLAQPVKTLELDEYHLLYESPENYVIKPPDSSGGDGISFPSIMEPEEVEALLEKVKARPEYYDVQELREPNTVIQYQMDSMGFIESFETTTDLRIFPSMDAAGNVRAGPHALLLRTAPKGALKSNTTGGGGYGQVAVTNGDYLDPSLKDYGLQLNAVVREHMGIGQQKSWQNLLDELIDIAVGQQPSLFPGLSATDTQIRLRDLSFRFRESLDLLPESMRRLPGLLREYADREDVSHELLGSLRTPLGRFLWDLYLSQESLEPIPRAISRKVFEARLGELLDSNRSFSMYASAYNASGVGVKLEYLGTPETVNFMLNKDNSTEIKYDVAKTLEIEGHPEMQALLKELQDYGGELRIPKVHTIDISGRSATFAVHGAFWVNRIHKHHSSYLRPTISLDVTMNRAWPSFAHEMEHFRYWKRIYEGLLEDGLDDTQAREQASIIVDQEEHLIKSEHAAVTAEINVERAMNEEARQKLFMRPIEDWEFGILNRKLYPEFEAMRRHLQVMNKPDVTDSEKEAAQKGAFRLLKVQVEEVVRGRFEALAFIADAVGLEDRVQGAVENIADKMDSNGRVRDVVDRLYGGHRSLSSHKQLWEDATIIDMIAFPYGVERIRAEGQVDLVKDLYTEVMSDLDLENDWGRSRLGRGGF